MPTSALQVAQILEADCIGCTRCIQACPVDAIVGAAGCLHTVIARWCTGCDLCVAVCPTDCIALHEQSAEAAAMATARAPTAQVRHDARPPLHARLDSVTALVDVVGMSALELQREVMEARRRRQSRT